MIILFQFISQIITQLLQSDIPDDIFIDIGSNNGYTSYFSSKKD
jgi:hypothetical protein